MRWLAERDADSCRDGAFSSPADAGDWIDCCLTTFALWYLTCLVAAVGISLGFDLLRPPVGRVTHRTDALDALTWMDGNWYKQIAVEGYQYDRRKRSNIAFFPVYPLLARAVAAATGLRAEAALLIVSNTSFLLALALLAAYARGGGAEGANEQAEWAVLAAALFPAGCFFRLAYSESTFLLLAVWAMYAMRRRWPPVGIALIVGLATAARPVGMALLAPFTIHLLRRGAGRRLAPAWLRLAVYLPLACWGLLAFMAFQNHAFGDAFASFHVQEHWSVRPPLPWGAKAWGLATLEPVRAVFDAQSPAFWSGGEPHGVPWFSLQFANPLYFLAATALVAFGAWRRWLTPEEWLLAAMLLLIPYATRGHEMGMGSMARFTAVVFPMYVVIGRLLACLPRAVCGALLGLSAIFLALYTALYGAGYFIF